MFLRRKSDGLTLVELLTCIAVLSVLLMLSIPSWQEAIEKYRAIAAQNQLRSLFHSARNSAVSYSSIVTLCPLDQLNVCSNNWDSTISVFFDPDNNRQLTSPDQLIQIHDIGRNGSLKASSAGNSERRFFQYNTDGTVRGSIGHLTWCPQSNNVKNAVHVIVNFGGRLRNATRNANDHPLMANGNPVKCPR